MPLGEGSEWYQQIGSQYGLMSQMWPQQQSSLQQLLGGDPLGNQQWSGWQQPRPKPIPSELFKQLGQESSAKQQSVFERQIDALLGNGSRDQRARGLGGYLRSLSDPPPEPTEEQKFLNDPWRPEPVRPLAVSRLDHKLNREMFPIRPWYWFLCPWWWGKPSNVVF